MNRTSSRGKPGLNTSASKRRHEAHATRWAFANIMVRALVRCCRFPELAGSDRSA
jgi:hypothetical protein